MGSVTMAKVKLRSFQSTELAGLVWMLRVDARGHCGRDVGGPRSVLRAVGVDVERVV
jgi:hypothetical protein